MLLLLFYVSKDLYAIESSCVVEVIPRVGLRKIHHVPEYVAGLFNYRGKIVPVIDLCSLIRGTPSRFCLSTRIMIVNYPHQQQGCQYLGLIAERITETLNKPETDFIDSGIHIPEAPYLGGILMDSKGIIQHINLEKLFTKVENTYSLTTGENYINDLVKN
ncbi:purine-binding chemotaxis protein CheW [Sphaerospermopsis aphanizomenoides BCCUSP55]|uniref:chemotaxis protein CheW n=1 Tax=Sphaerospermopsis aphanizomenoides TaxID=459663 RepID=UPI001905526C|nr:chemotaxis protein CheW [Sphaerospermopsis aphanizomenoides]MBK1988793.1 purine-binding chemotaxis protein CheW [Sphaerospermopsis aphanizomenoides BCCUSP55]